MSDERYIERPPAGADDWREIWREDRRYRPAAGSRELFLRAARRLVRSSLGPDADRQRDFNVALLDLLGDVERDLQSLRDDLKRDLAAVQIDMRIADEALAREVAAVRELIPIAARRNDALIAALDQKIETVAARLRDLLNPSVSRSLQETARSSDYLYRRLEDGLRGSPAEVRQEMEHYVALVRQHQPVIDVGCGRGEFLSLCAEAGVEACGYDTNERSVADLRAKGLNAELAAIPECLAQTSDESLGSIVATHVIEHLPVGALLDLFREAARSLRAGGLLIIETPNAESILVGASNFWRDPTHIAPRHPAALVLLGREHGFAVEEVRAVHPFPEGTGLSVAAEDTSELRRLIEEINDRLFAPQDLRLILRKA